MLPFFEIEAVACIPSRRIENPKTVGDRLYNSQLELKISQNEMAQRIGVDPENIINLRLRGRTPYISIMPKIIKFLGYNPILADMTTIAGRMEHYRVEHGFTQEDLTDLLGVDKTTVRDWEKGTREPLPENARKLKRFYTQKSFQQKALLS